jgi:hypothetical protein
VTNFFLDFICDLFLCKQVVRQSPIWTVFFRIEYNAFQLVRFDRICNNIVKEEFEDSKSATRSRKTNKDRQYKDKNNELQNITLKIEQHKYH